MFKVDFYKGNRRKGFSLIEILVVIALIGILAAVVLASYSGAREESKIAKSKSDLKNIELGLKAFVLSEGVMPPVAGDICTLCGWKTSTLVPSQQAQWSTIVVAEVSSRTAARLPERDPWGRYYAYDNNYGVALRTLPSIVCSLGSDGILQTWATDLLTSQRIAQGDDLCIFMNEPEDT